VELGRITGQVVSTVKQNGLHSYKLLLVDTVDPSTGTATDATTYVAVDLTGAGPGDVVVVTRGSAARVAAGAGEIPTDAAVVAIVDSVVVDGAMTFSNSVNSVSSTA
jgi:microcompartment protein CcmK/EutM